MTISINRIRRICKLLVLLVLAAGLVSVLRDRNDIPTTSVSNTEQEAPAPAAIRNHIVIEEAYTDASYSHHQSHAIQQPIKGRGDGLPSSSDQQAVQQADFDTAHARGCKLFSYLESADPPPAHWISWDQIEHYGWTRLSYPSKGLNKRFNPPLLTPVADGGLGVPATGSGGLVTLWNHEVMSEVTYEKDGQQLRYNVTNSQEQCWTAKLN